MTTAVLFALLVVLCNAVSSRILEPLELEDFSSKDLDLMELEQLMLSDAHRYNDLKNKRDEFLEEKDLVEKLFGDSEKRANLCPEDKNPQLCARYEKWCTLSKTIFAACPKTCGVECKAPAPRKCDSSKFGCCWDDSDARGPNPEDCPVCADKMGICGRFKSNCEKPAAEKFMKHKCPETCGLCDQVSKK
uniref:Toxin candidate TRINITY_DN22809_c0_g1_i1 n=1 Tax=Pachycerianthus borealis TaxID=2736680 RepID=A0A7G7WZ28_9CNID|nr:toxin candidate TRINITY_DN22809_c0_g1_i1 [Pachycerianthus borealis]